MRSTSSNGHILTYPGLWAFMFSPMPVIYKYEGTGAAPTSVSLTVRCQDNGRSFTETRQLSQQSSARFDISRICQELAPELDTLADSLKGPDEPGDGAFNPCAAFFLSVITLTNSSPVIILFNAPIYTRYGACDPGEVYSNSGAGLPSVVPFCINYPQTVTVYAGYSGSAAIMSKDGKIIHEFESCPICAEIYPLKVFTAEELNDYADDLASGEVDLRTYRQICSDGDYSGTVLPAFIRLAADDTPADAPGRFFLRWLNRRGEFRYRLFYGGDYKVTVSESESFTRIQGYDEYTPSAGRTYANPNKVDFTVARTLALGAPGVTAEEFDELVELAASPLVHLYRHNSESAGTSCWLRVNVQAGSYSRSRRRGTPQRMDFEINVILPPQNNPKL